jgi:uncharacterized membrane protein
MLKNYMPMIDSISVTATIFCILFLKASWQAVDNTAKFIATVLTIVAAVSTIYYNYKKLNKNE